MKNDITNREDIILLVDTFYTKVRANETLGYIFDEVAKVDWPHHLPKMYAFWAGIIFGEPGYTGNAMSPHIVLGKKTPLGEKEFSEWLRLFNQTVDELFSGGKAEETKSRAGNIANLMMYKVQNG